MSPASPHAPFLLGIDQGGTKTHAAACGVDGTVLGQALAGPVIFRLDDPDNLSSVRAREAALAALADAGLAPSQASGVCCGANGADWEFEHPLLARRLGQALDKPAEGLWLLNDCLVAMRAGSLEKSQGHQAVLCAGTGLNAAVRAADGREAVFGYYIRSRDNAATALGQAAWEAVWSEAAGLGPATSMTEAILRHANKPDVETLFMDMTERRYAWRPSEWSPLLLAAAREGDPVAAGTAERMARGMADYVAAGMKRLGLAGEPVDVVFTGGMLKGDGRPLISRASAALAAAGVRHRAVDALYEPVAGALLLLLDRHYGGEAPAEALGRFAETAARFTLLRQPAG